MGAHAVAGTAPAGTRRGRELGRGPARSRWASPRSRVDPLCPSTRAVFFAAACWCGPRAAWARPAHSAAALAPGKTGPTTCTRRPAPNLTTAEGLSDNPTRAPRRPCEAGGRRHEPTPTPPAAASPLGRPRPRADRAAIPLVRLLRVPGSLRQLGREGRPVVADLATRRRLEQCPAPSWARHRATTRRARPDQDSCRGSASPTAPHRSRRPDGSSGRRH